jgi:hypothetical protein
VTDRKDEKEEEEDGLVWLLLYAHRHRSILERRRRSPNLVYWQGTVSTASAMTLQTNFCCS